MDGTRPLRARGGDDVAKSQRRDGGTSPDTWLCHPRPGGEKSRLDFTSIHGRLGLPKSSTHNLLGTLSRLGVLRMRPDRGFVLGLKLTELGAFAASHRFVEAESVPLLRALASELQLTCHLGVSEGPRRSISRKLNAIS